jgi:hypothetical protein
VPEPLDAEGEHFAASDRRLFQLQLSDGTEPSPIFVATGTVEQQIIDGANFQA